MCKVSFYKRNSGDEECVIINYLITILLLSIKLSYQYELQYIRIFFNILLVIITNMDTKIQHIENKSCDQAFLPKRGLISFFLYV